MGRGRHLSQHADRRGPGQGGGGRPKTNKNRARGARGEARAGLGDGDGTAPVHLTCRAGRLSWPTGSTRAAIGKGGARVLKREGDLATPIGDFALLRGFFRADRVKLPATAMPMSALTPSDAWVDDVKDAEYNRFVR